MALSVTIKQRGTNQGDTNDTARSSHIDRHCSIIMVSTRETSIYESKYYRTSTLLTPTSSGQLETFEEANNLLKTGETQHCSLLTAHCEVVDINVWLPKHSIVSRCVYGVRAFACDIVTNLSTKIRLGPLGKRGWAGSKLPTGRYGGTQRDHILRRVQAAREPHCHHGLLGYPSAACCQTDPGFWVWEKHVLRRSMSE